MLTRIPAIANIANSYRYFAVVQDIVRKILKYVLDHCEDVSVIVWTKKLTRCLSCKTATYRMGIKSSRFSTYKTVFVFL